MTADVFAAIDTHVHFWDLTRCSYPWLEDKAWSSIRTNYLPTHFKADIADVGLQAFVHVEAGVDPSVDPVDETAWLASLVASTPDLPPMVCVGYADLRAPDLDDVLSRQLQHGIFRGVRQEVWFDPTSCAPGALHRDLLSDHAWIAGLGKLAQLDLSFDLLASPDQLHQAAILFRNVPELRVILDHLAVPALVDGVPPQLWREGLRQFAAEVPRSVLKVSGLAMIDPSWNATELAALVHEALDTFGSQRCALGSNFPVDRPACSYTRLWQMYADLADTLPEADKVALLSGTAQEFYRIDLD